MTQDEIIKIAKEAGLPCWSETGIPPNLKQLTNFANLVAEAERNRIEKVCYKIYDDDMGDAWDCVKAIREMK